MTIPRIILGGLGGLITALIIATFIPMSNICGFFMGFGFSIAGIGVAHLI